MATRGIRRKKSSLSEVKVAVYGAPTVGKSGRILLIFFLNLRATINYFKCLRHKSLSQQLKETFNKKKNKEKYQIIYQNIFYL